MVGGDRGHAGRLGLDDHQPERLLPDGGRQHGDGPVHQALARLGGLVAQERDAGIRWPPRPASRRRAGLRRPGRGGCRCPPAGAWATTPPGAPAGPSPRPCAPGTRSAHRRRGRAGAVGPDEVGLDHQAVPGEAGTGEQLALGRRQHEEPLDAPLPPPRVDDDRRGVRHRQQRRTPVAAVPHTSQWAAAEAVVADGAIAEQRAARAHEPVVVQRRHHGHPCCSGSGQDGRAEQRERVVQVHDVWLEPLDRSGQVSLGVARPTPPSSASAARCRGPNDSMTSLSTSKRSTAWPPRPRRATSSSTTRFSPLGASERYRLCTTRTRTG